MKTNLQTHQLTGCGPTPLASYLKALGVLRLVGEQIDPQVKGWWSGDIFHLKTKLTKEELCEFFVNEYQPTPIIAPWNGGSGFFPKDNRTAITAIRNSQTDRLANYRETIESAFSVLRDCGLSEKPDGDAKAKVLMACRNRLSEEAIESLDAAFVLTDGGPKYPPLLGTGFNDGRLEFSNNFMQRMLDLIDVDTGRPTRQARGWWEEAFFAQPQDGLQKDSILGQFDPGAVDRSVNPWDFVLMLEGALTFSTAAVKRLESIDKGLLSYPFCVRATGVGYGSATTSDEDSCRAEMWLPLWTQPCTRREVTVLFSEGRAQVSRRAAKNGVDFARAVSTLGVDRGITEFSRVGFHSRNGLAYFAVPLGRFIAERNPQVDLLAEPQLDRWLDSFRRGASSDTAPGSAGRASRVLDSAIIELCKTSRTTNFQAVLVALGEAEEVLAKSSKWREEAFQKPVPLLSPQWLQEAHDGTPEFRLAASLAGIYSPSIGNFRQYLEPVKVENEGSSIRKRWPVWMSESEDEGHVVWNAGSLEINLVAIMQRRMIQAIRRGETPGSNLPIVLPLDTTFHASLDDVMAFLSNQLDDNRISSLVSGLILVDWTAVRSQNRRDEYDSREVTSPINAAYGLLKLCHTPYQVNETYVRLDPTIARLLAADQLESATALAIRRLRGSSLEPAVDEITESTISPRRLAAALLFPLSLSSNQTLAQRVLKRPKKDLTPS
ncbi:type I-G CRISPR-associated protein Cas8g1/Csx17 [Planctopirus hydrillae]|uniref:Type I-U CRISPR-associated protein Csx17 n=1 Tax=Planctopirus hydrillae TaxID=1841610 RepID=A0A1C3EFT4_9PLAN|nr:type I-U CRISPR-associated protein Csx17 [Planctopirus hydrillae]ODA32080.1 type I-U CRISPR-associated protein Csx17 [Planctopirus hydrillae]